MPLFVILILCAATLAALGSFEKIRNRKYVDQLRIRVNVNGIRGKSTATRLITSILHEAGIRTIGKTTGTAARFIDPAAGTEEAIVRKPEGPNIKEQTAIIRRAAKLKAQALVCECMAIHPEYQDVYQNDMFMANITLIVNVREDHLDVMGPTLDEVAQAFSRSIPYNGHLITTQGQYTEFFSQIARERNTQVLIADTDRVPEGYVDQFEYVVFPDNVALGLACADILGIDSETALRGMLKAAPDPGALRINYLNKKTWRNSVFVNGFAANEPKSSLKIWNLIQERHELPLANPIVLFNGRSDRVDRTDQFVKEFFPQLKDVVLIAMGQSVQHVQRAMNRGRFPGVKEYLHWEDMSPQSIVHSLKELMDNRLIFGVGNIHGDAELLVEYLMQERE